MRVLVFCADPGVPIHGPSGASAHLRGVARALQSLGHEVAVAALHDHDPRGRHDVPLGVPSLTSEPSRWPSGVRGVGELLAARALLARAIRTFGTPDLIWERYSLWSDAGVRAARRGGFAHLLEVNAPLSLDRRRAGRESVALRQTGRVVAVSPWLRDWALARGAVEARWVPNGSDLVRTREPDAEGLHLVHHGSVRPWHGTGFFPELLDALPDARLTLIGGHLEHPRVSSWSPVDPPRLQDLLSAAHVSLAPYPADASPWYDPLKLWDSAVLGLPSVGSLHPCTREATVRVPLGVSAWADAVRTLKKVRCSPVVRPWTTVVQEALSP